MGLVTKGDNWRIPDKLWKEIKPLLPKGKPHPLGCHNPRVSDRDAMTAILFVARTGCQWNALNATKLCSSSSAHRRFQEWEKAGVFKELWRRGLLEYDNLKGIDWEWLSMDGAITKAPLGGDKTGPSPVDRSKSGTKRSLLTDAKGIPLAIEVEGANRHDVKLFGPTLEGIIVERPKPDSGNSQNICLDKGYRGDEVKELSKCMGLNLHISSGKTGLLEEGKKARRWVVERTHSWTNRFRGLLIRWSKKEENYMGMLQLACGVITWKATGQLR